MKYKADKRTCGFKIQGRAREACDLVIKTVYHNRTVVLPAEQLALSGISKGDYVIVKVAGDEIHIKKVKLCEQAYCNKHCI